MLLTVIAAFALAQDPVVPTTQAAVPPVAATPAAPPTAREARMAAQRRHGGDQVCHERPPTGSVLRRRTCQTQRRAESDAARAQAYVQEVTKGTAHEPMPIGPGPTPN